MKTMLVVFKNFMILLTVSCICFQVHAQSASSIKIEIKNVAPQKALIIKTTAQSSAVGQKMGELYGKLFGYLGANSIQPSGAPFAVYYSYDPTGKTEFEVGVPVASSITGTDDIKFKEYPAMRVISTLHIGPYENVGPIYEALKKYATDHKLQTQPVSWEVYITDPSKETDPNKYQTFVYFVLK
jgi:effector-binding domain-containing protein